MITDVALGTEEVVWARRGGGVWKRQRYIKNPGFCLQRRLRLDLVLLLVVLVLALAVEMALLQPLHPLTIRLCGRV